MKALKIISGLLGGIVALAAIPLLVVGAGMFSISDGEQVDLPTISTTSSSRAITFGEIDLEIDGAPSGWEGFEEVTVSVDGEDLFIGVARSSDVDWFLRSDLKPSDVDIWLGASSGANPTLDIDEDGLWTAVVMNSDGSRGVDADVSMTLPATPVRFAAATVLGAGAMAAIAATLLFVVAFRRGTPAGTPPTEREPELV